MGRSSVAGPAGERAQLAVELDTVVVAVAGAFGLDVAVLVGPAGDVARAELDKVREARREAWTALRARGVPWRRIGARFGVSAQAVQDAVQRAQLGRERAQLARRARMLPIAGVRRACELDAECLGEFVRAMGPAEVRFCSCPVACAAFVPRELGPEREQRSRADPTW